MGLTCPSCHFPLHESFYFCPNCGKKLKDPPVSTGIGKQIGIYLVSILLPPIGFWPGVKYMLSPDKKAQIIGVVAILLTFISTIITVWYTYQIYIQLQQALNAQLQAPQSLGL
jgi:hypothetical protein